jgi:hypothetical protein
MLRFDGEVFLFGTAISAPVSYLLAMGDDMFSHPFIPRPLSAADRSGQTHHM